jgi:hypothetical protein
MLHFEVCFGYDDSRYKILIKSNYSNKVCHIIEGKAAITSFWKKLRPNFATLLLVLVLAAPDPVDAPAIAALSVTSPAVVMRFR